jgi:transglutaminase-like putative cysteine protease
LYSDPDGIIGHTLAGQTHAWVEAWVGDWVALDPTDGSFASERHVLVARGRDYADVPPLKGIYSGAPAKHLDVSVELTRVA